MLNIFLITKSERANCYMFNHFMVNPIINSNIDYGSCIESVCRVLIFVACIRVEDFGILFTDFDARRFSN